VTRPVTRPLPSRLFRQTLADESVDLLSEEVALLASHARQRLPSSLLPPGHVWVYSATRALAHSPLVLCRLVRTSPLHAGDTPYVALLLIEPLAEPVECGRTVAPQRLKNRLVIIEGQRRFDGDLSLDRVGELVGGGREPLGSEDLGKKASGRCSEPDASDTHALDATRISAALHEAFAHAPLVRWQEHAARYIGSG
jgi:hypothetical protein